MALAEFRLDGGEKNITRALLDNDEIVIYDACGDTNPNEKCFVFIGEGVIHSVNDVRQSGNEKRKFYRKTR